MPVRYRTRSRNGAEGTEPQPARAIGGARTPSIGATLYAARARVAHASTEP